MATSKVRSGFGRAADVAGPAEEGDHFYRPELDVLRFLASLLIFCHHAISDFFPVHSPLRVIGKACGSGLQLFFLLSSYLITELLLREREKTGSIHLTAFFVRRMLRIWPLYFFFIGFSLIVSKLTHFTILTTREFAFYLLLAGNWWTFFHGFIPTIAGPLWSISVEEQYYLIWPFLGRFGGRGSLWVASLFFAGLSFGALVDLGNHHAARASVWSNSLVEFLFFAVGAMLAMVLHGRVWSVPAWLRISLFAVALGTIVYAQAQFHIVSDFPVGASSLVMGYGLFAVATTLLFLSFLQARLPHAFQPLIALGKISYGLYVFHDLSIRLVDRAGLRFQGAYLVPSLKSVLALIICLVCALLSYRLLELPFLHLKRRFTFVPTRVD